MTALPNKTACQTRFNAAGIILRTVGKTGSAPIQGLATMMFRSAPAVQKTKGTAHRVAVFNAHTHMYCMMRQLDKYWTLEVQRNLLPLIRAVESIPNVDGALWFGGKLELQVGLRRPIVPFRKIHTLGEHSAAYL